MATSGLDWFLSGVTAASAVATASAAFFTARMAAKTSNLADATKQDADASVALVRESQTDRELAHRPVLVLDGMTLTADGVQGTPQVRNVGTGPALNCIGVFRLAPGRQDTRWLETIGRRHIYLNETTSGFSVALSKSNFDPFFPDASDRFLGALLCSDVLDRRHVFYVTHDNSSTLSVYRAESVRANASNAPPWATDLAFWMPTS